MGAKARHIYAERLERDRSKRFSIIANGAHVVTDHLVGRAETFSCGWRGAVFLLYCAERLKLGVSVRRRCNFY